MLVQKQLELSSLEDWDLARFLAIQDLMNLAGEMARRIAKLGGVGHQPTGFDIFSIGVDGWQPVSPDQFDNVFHTADQFTRRADRDCIE